LFFGRKYNIIKVTQHRLPTPYHPQMNDQAKTSNKQLKDILKMAVIKGQKNWSKKLDEHYGHI
jgi:hypothetical protein